LGHLARLGLLTDSFAYSNFASVNATVYGRGQMVIPSKARKAASIKSGDVLDVQAEGNGRIVLIRLEKPKPRKSRIKIIKRVGRHAVGFAGRPISSEQIRAFLNDFP
jgi:AbrB family looped-hinge helix DNA binding protein